MYNFKMTNKEDEIMQAFDGKLVGLTVMKKWVCKTLAAMNDEIISFVTTNCWFVTSMEDAWGFTFTGNDLKNMHLIFLSESLFEQTQKQIQYSIAHEIGHIMLGHRNSTLVRQGKQEIAHQEMQAHKFAKSFGF